MGDNLKVVRGQRKAAVTRLLGKIERHIAEDDADIVQAKLNEVKTAFSELEVAHDAYAETLENEPDIVESESWLEAAYKDYTKRYKAAREWLLSRKPVIKPDIDNGYGGKNAGDKGSVDDEPDEDAMSQYDLIKLLSIPKVEIDKYGGNPSEFQNFISIFDEMVGSQIIDDQTKLTRLIYYTTGPAKCAIKNCALTGGSIGYKKARDILSERFGNAHLISQSIINELKCGMPISKSVELQQLADELSMASVSLDKLCMLSEIDNQQSIMDILGRCPVYLQNKWRNKALECKRQNDNYPTFDDFVEFVCSKAQDLCDPVYGADVFKARRPQKAASSQLAVSSGAPVPAAAMAPAGATAPPVRKSHQPATNHCIICSQNHSLFQCDKFKAMRPSVRFQFVKDNKMCYNCLSSGHFANDCKRNTVCTVAGCGLKHTKFIHTDDNSTSSTDTVAGAAGQGASNASACGNSSNVYRPMVAVYVNGVRTLALLDNGSTNTFMAQSLASRLALSGPREKLVVTTLSRTAQLHPRVVKCNVSSVDGVFSENLDNVCVVDSVPTRYPVVEIDISLYSHLVDIPLTKVHKGDTAELLIGMDNSHLLLPLEVRYDPSAIKSPYATRTLLGWALNGLVGKPGGSDLNEVSCFHATVEQNVNNLWDIENNEFDDVCHSIEDHKVLELWQSEITLENGHYTLPIPWKDTRPSLPNNKYLAVSRLESQIKRLNKAGLLSTYEQNLTQMCDKGYAERVPESELLLDNGSVWYLPHHHVLSQSKPGKIRIVFDCAAKYKGVSLNNQCLQGPDLVNKLVSVLLRFRQFRYGIMADIEGMYLQVRIPMKDRNALRFLWLEDDQLVEYRMTSHLFGGVWCSSSSAYALRQTVADLPEGDMIKDTVLKSFYVDDLLKSAQNSADAMHIANETKRAVSRGGFNLTKFVINDSDMLGQIDESDRATDVKDLVPDMKSKALGVRWQVSKDTFYYVVNEIDGTKKITRRAILSHVASMYDPLGQISPIVLKGKIIFQDATRRGLSWDDDVPGDLATKWQLWQSSLRDLHKLTFPRCIVPMGFENGAAELHHFCDASTVGYGACSYLRIVRPDGKIHVALIASKGRLAPIKSVTIPHLELTAAVVAIQLDAVIKSSLDIQCISSTYWCDSQIVLAYIRSEVKRFKVFVANRVAKIRQCSEPDQWRFISGRMNPADILSRGSDVGDIPEIWFKGPNFLTQFKCDWPKDNDDLQVSVSDRELEVISAHTDEVSVLNTVCDNSANTQSTSVTLHPIDAVMAYYSSYYKAKKALCWLRRFVTFMESKSMNKDKLTVTELADMELLILKHVQKTEFGKEIEEISQNGHVSRSNRLAKLCPGLENGLMVIGGRLKHASTPEQSRHPVILPKYHRVSQLICQEFHCHGHMGTEWVLSRVRQYYWIINGRALIKKIRYACLICKRYYSMPCNQRMADLPPERCQAGSRPFICIGIDVFGPFSVSQGRARVKRYGCVYTCFGTRAIHIEMLPSLEADAFINSLVRFSSRRGSPSSVWSDNGTNFVGAQAELKHCFRQLDREKLTNAARRLGIEWNFNTPYASHHGGIWERMIRIIRQILIVLLNPSSRFTDDVLVTVFCEVENLINSRPLTKCSDDTNDDSPLTPNHLLVMHGNYSYPWAVTHESDIYRKRWRYVQHVATQFWKRWIREYLPELQRRQKWLQPQPNIKQGDLVLIMDESSPRGSWPLGLVEDTKTGRDGLVRSARIRSRSTHFVRPITKLVLLEGAHYAS